MCQLNITAEKLIKNPNKIVREDANPKVQTEKSYKTRKDLSMPNFDTSTIEGFESMTADQKVEALLKADIPERIDLSKYVSKETFDKKASEAASLSKQLKDKMTDDEAKEAEKNKIFEDMKSELENLKKEKQLSDLTSNYLNLGYEKELAVEAAKARMDGDLKKEFEIGEKHRLALEKKWKAEAIDRTHNPGGAGGDDDKDKPDKAVEKAKELAKARYGTNFNDAISKYK